MGKTQQLFLVCQIFTPNFCKWHGQKFFFGGGGLREIP